MTGIEWSAAMFKTSGFEEPLKSRTTTSILSVFKATMNCKYNGMGNKKKKKKTF